MIPKAPDSVRVTLLTWHGASVVMTYENATMREVLDIVDESHPDATVEKLELVYGEDD